MTHPAVQSIARTLRDDPTPAYTAHVVAGELVVYDVSDSWMAYYGGTREDWTGSHPLARFAPSPEQVPEWYAALDTALAGNPVVFPFVAVPLHSGVTRYMNGKLLPVFDADGIVRGVFSQATPLDDKMEAMARSFAQLTQEHAELQERVVQLERRLHA